MTTERPNRRGGTWKASALAVTALGVAANGLAGCGGASTGGTGTTPDPTARGSRPPVTADLPALQREVSDSVVAYRDVQLRVLRGEAVTDDEVERVARHGAKDLLVAARGADPLTDDAIPSYDRRNVLVFDPTYRIGADGRALTPVGRQVLTMQSRGWVAVLCARTGDRVVGVVVGVDVLAGRHPLTEYLPSEAGFHADTPGVLLATGATDLGVTCSAKGTPSLEGR